MFYSRDDVGVVDEDDFVISSEFELQVTSPGE